MRKIEKKTGFSSPASRWDLTSFSFELKTAPSCFQTIVNHAFTALPGSKVQVYLNNIIILGDTCSNYFIKLEQVQERLMEAKLTLKIEKCKTEVDNLGHIISSENIRLQPSKIKVIKDIPAIKCRRLLVLQIATAHFFPVTRKLFPSFKTVRWQERHIKEEKR